MKIWIGTVLGLAMAVGLSAATAIRPEAWKAVDDDLEKGLPRSALEKLQPMVQQALQDQAWAEAAKAITRSITVQAELEGNRPETRIRLLDAQLAQAPTELQPLLETLQANWYWQYFRQNRWRFMQRTTTTAPAAAPDDDLTTWDLPRIYLEIDRRFQRALADPAVLKSTPVGEFDGFLVPGALGDAYRPTLYDFIAHQALEFYTSPEQAVAKAEGAFELEPGSPVFDSLENFLDWRVVERVTDPAAQSTLVKAISVYQGLIRFHQQDTDPTALADLDLGRLGLGWDHAGVEGKAVRYEAALKAFVERWADSPVAAMGYHQWAQVRQGENDLSRAWELADRGRTIYPDSPGGRLCHNLIQEIEAPSARIQCERVWNDPWPPVRITYRNLTNVYLRVVPWDWHDFLRRERSRPEQMRTPQERQELLTRKPVLAWSTALPATPDFQEREQDLALPTQLPPGFYFLVASFEPGFDEEDNQVLFSDFWVSDLALVVRPADRAVEGFVLDARTGDPLEGAEVMAWHLEQGNRVPLAAPLRTDTNGFFRLPSIVRRGWLVRARYRFGDVQHELSSMQEYSSQYLDKSAPHERAVLFTDRALYRPGQSLHYKGICLRLDPEKDNYQVLAGRKVTLVLRDPNGRKLAQSQHTANRFGSFSGTFTLPGGGLMGRLRLQTDDRDLLGAAWVAMEEYKRPKFQVTMEAPLTPARLREEVQLEGRAQSYTGTPIDGAAVSYRVVREVRWPDWWRGRGRWMPPAGASQEIAHGTTTTDITGKFEVRFPALPDPSARPEDEPVFSYTVHADVTDSNGETRTAERVVRVGYTALQAALSAEDWQTVGAPVTVTAHTRTLDGQPQPAEGVLRIHRLKAPDRVQRPALSPGRPVPYRFGGENPSDDPSDPDTWPLGEVALEQGFTTSTNGLISLEARLPVGAYRAVLATQDRFGTAVRAELSLQVLDPASTRLEIPIPNLLAAPSWSVAPGSDLVALWGTGYPQGRVFVEIEHRGEIVRKFWTPVDTTQVRIAHPVTESMRGGFTLHLTRVQENRAYLESRYVDVPWSNKDLEISWEHLTSKLDPNRSETWTAVIQRRAGTASANDPQPAVAEMVATLYDASLDAYLPLRWPRALADFRRDTTHRYPDFLNIDKPFQYLHGQWPMDQVAVEVSYREFPFFVGAGGYPTMLTRGGRQAVERYGLAAPARGAPEPTMAAAPMAMSADRAPAESAGTDALLAKGADIGGGEGDPAPAPDLSQVSARTNLTELAAFFPQLLSDTNGVVRITFTMPEALTTWRFLGFAHDAELRSGTLQTTAVTAKDLMAQPNPPRFLREGDTLEFPVKISNASDQPQSGRVRLNLRDAATDESLDGLFGNAQPELEFNVPAGESRGYQWRLQVPDGARVLVYRVVASSGRLSDGEEGYLPVLSRRVLITESLPLPIRGPGTRTFRFDKLLQSGDSPTLQHQGVTVQMVSNPAWYAVLALPYLMEFPHECSEQTFNRFYANTLARTVALSDPKIRAVFDHWRATPALDSPLEKNQDLKSVLIEETPWLRQARNESQARRNVGLLFAEPRLDDEAARALRKIEELQLDNGFWPWFPGGPASEYMTLYITSGFGRLRHLGADVSVARAVKALQGLDGWMAQRYQQIQKHPKPEDHVPTATEALYLYARSFFLKDQPPAAEHQIATDFFLGQARKFWLPTGNRQTQGHLALALARWPGPGNASLAADILRSLKERSVVSEELGRFWQEEDSWWWYRAPIETQALMIEAFDEVLQDAAAVEELKVWLIKQKQTQDWKTTKATADAVYALLLRGTDLLASTSLVHVTVGNLNITPEAANAEAGTGFYERRFPAAEVRPALGEITVRKVDSGVAWGGVHWQYLEDLSRITPHAGTPLQLNKQVFVRRNSARGPVLEPVDDSLSVGDELVVRIELRVDREMEYVHLKDQRASGTEPVNVLSRYRYQDGLGYYESTRDTATHFFIDSLPRGTYVLEYPVRVQHRGQYLVGPAEIQCMYAPEFNSHSGSVPLRVQ